MASWQNGELTKCWVDKMLSWQNVKLTKCQAEKCQFDRILIWQNAKLTEYWFYKMPSLQNAISMEYFLYKMTSWQNAGLPNVSIIWICQSRAFVRQASLSTKQFFCVKKEVW